MARSTRARRQDKSKRKQRTVKNAYVDIDSVTEEPGFQYQNWISIAKQKLKVNII